MVVEMCVYRGKGTKPTGGTSPRSFIITNNLLCYDCLKWVVEWESFSSVWCSTKLMLLVVVLSSHLLLFGGYTLHFAVLIIKA